MASTSLVLDQEPQETIGGPRVPSRVLLCPSQLTRKPFSENGCHSCTNFNIPPQQEGHSQHIDNIHHPYMVITLLDVFHPVNNYKVSLELQTTLHLSTKHDLIDPLRSYS